MWNANDDSVVKANVAHFHISLNLSHFIPESLVPVTKMFSTHHLYLTLSLSLNFYLSLTIPTLSHYVNYFRYILNDFTPLTMPLFPSHSDVSFSYTYCFGCYVVPPERRSHSFEKDISENLLIKVFLTLAGNSRHLGADDDDHIAQQIEDAEAKAPEDLTEQDKMVLLGRPKCGEIVRAQLRIKESKEFKVSLRHEKLFE